MNHFSISSQNISMKSSLWRFTLADVKLEKYWLIFYVTWCDFVHVFLCFFGVELISSLSLSIPTNTFFSDIAREKFSIIFYCSFCSEIESSSYSREYATIPLSYILLVTFYFINWRNFPLNSSVHLIVWLIYKNISIITPKTGMIFWVNSLFFMLTSRDSNTSKQIKYFSSSILTSLEGFTNPIIK